MKSLSEILLRHPVPGLRQSERSRICAEVIQKEIGITLKPSQIVYKEGVLTFKIPSVLKSEIMLHKNKLIHLLKDASVEVTDLH